MRWLSGVLLASMVGVAGAVPITVNFMDGANEGFNDPTLGAQRQAAFNYAVGVWSSALMGTTPVVVDATMDPLGGTASAAILGYAYATTLHRNFAGAPVANTWYVGALANQLAGTDVNGAMSEIVAVFNSDVDNATVLGAVDWYYGTDANPPESPPGSGRFDTDFVSVVLHEIGHGLGFTSEVDGGTCVGGSTPGDSCGVTADCSGGSCDLSTVGTWADGSPSAYDLFLVRPAASPPRFTDMSDAQRKSATTSGNVFWDGANVVTAHGGNAKIYAPSPFQPGSSISHWDTSLTPDELHEPFYTGPNHNPGLSLNAFADEGWTVGPTTTTSSSTTTTTTIPFGGDDTGCVPDSRDRLKCGDAIGKAFGNAIRAVIKCHKKQADDRFNGVSDTITGPAEDLCANGPNGGRSAKEKLDAAIGKVSFLCSASQLAAAATQESTLFAGQTNAASLDAQNGDVYCETGTAIDPSGDDAGQIPSTKDRLTCADTVGSELGKLAAAVIKCHQKQADAVFAGKTFDENACEELDPVKHKSAVEKYGAAMSRLDTKGICTQTCLSRPNRDALGANVLAQIEAANQVAYPCP